MTDRRAWLTIEALRLVCDELDQPLDPALDARLADLPTPKLGDTRRIGHGLVRSFEIVHTDGIVPLITTYLDMPAAHPTLPWPARPAALDFWTFELPRVARVVGVSTLTAMHFHGNGVATAELQSVGITRLAFHKKEPPNHDDQATD